MTKPGPKPGKRGYALQESDYSTSYVQEYVRCGKPTCPQCTGAARGHGPYWYSYRYSPTAKRRRKWYLGKDGPPTVGEFTHTAARASAGAR